ncbi:unnamed protein product [Ixodes pacificus]
MQLRDTKSYDRKFLIQNIPGKTNTPSNRQISKESNRRHILRKKKKSASETTTRSICSALRTAKRTTIPPINVNLAGFIRDSHIINLRSKQHHSRFGCALQTPF